MKKFVTQEPPDNCGVDVCHQEKIVFITD